MLNCVGRDRGPHCPPRCLVSDGLFAEDDVGSRQTLHYAFTLVFRVPRVD